MKELKTLADINHMCCCGNSPQHDMAIRDDLRAEAIKDIKHIRETHFVPCRGVKGSTWCMPVGNGLGEDTEAMWAVVEYIAWKFNISEEDLR